MSKKIDGKLFVPDFKCVRQSNGFISPLTGEVVLWSVVEQSVWSTLRDQYFFFTSQNKEMYNTMEQLSSLCNISKSAISRAVSLLEKHHLVSVEKSVKGSKVNFKYTNVEFPITVKALTKSKMIVSFVYLDPVSGSPLKEGKSLRYPAKFTTPKEPDSVDIFGELSYDAPPLPTDLSGISFTEQEDFYEQIIY